jgi:hypothetical protein
MIKLVQMLDETQTSLIPCCSLIRELDIHELCELQLPENSIYKIFNDNGNVTTWDTYSCPFDPDDDMGEYLDQLDSILTEFGLPCELASEIWNLGTHVSKEEIEKLTECEDDDLTNQLLSVMNTVWFGTKGIDFFPTDNTPSQEDIDHLNE